MPEGVNSATTAVAYEPLWAVGTGQAPAAQQISEMHTHIRHCLEVRFGGEGRATRILYGGSVNASNVHEIFALPEVGGALIEGASLKATEFEAVIKGVAQKVELRFAA